LFDLFESRRNEIERSGYEEEVIDGKNLYQFYGILCEHLTYTIQGVKEYKYK
jgi:hypothetical protein